MKIAVILKFYQTYKLYLFPAIVVLSSLFLILFAIYPQTVKLLNNQQTVENLTVKSKFLESKVTALERYEGVNLPQKVEVALSAFPAEKDYGNVFSLLQQLSAESGFIISSISVGNAANKTGAADNFAVKVDMKGSKMLLQNLLNNIESTPRLMRINSIELTGSAEQVSSVLLAMDVLFSELPKNLGTIDSPVPELTEKDEQLISSLTQTVASAPQPSTGGFRSPRGKADPFN